MDGIVVIDQNGAIEGFNRAAERVFGYHAAEVLGHNVKMLMPEPYHSEHDGYLAAYRATDRPKIIGIGREVVGRRKDGTTFPMDLAVGESRFEDRRLFAGIVRDITARKRMEDELRESEERFRLLVDNIRDYAIVTFDTAGAIKSWNAGSQRLCGWPAGEAIGKPISLFFLPGREQEGQDILAHVRECGRFEGKGQRVRRDGSTFWAHEIDTPLWDRTGHMRGFVHISHDVTGQMETDHALRAAKEDAERANRAKTQFLQAASHDLRQPAQALVLYASALESRVGDREAAAPILTNLKGSLATLNGLLGVLLDVSKLEAGIITPEPTIFALAEAIDEAVRDFEPQAARKGIRVKMVATTAMVRSDRTLFGRIVRNLMSNAVRYTERGRILVGCRLRGQTIRVEVLDTGTGIPKDKLEEIFHEFVQVGNPERDRDQGLGLGLAIVRRLARVLGCPVTVRSTEGKGSAFSVELPLLGFSRARNLAFLSSPQARPAAPPAKGLIFVIDDENAVLTALRMLIQDWGYEVVAAHSEDEAMEALDHQPRPPDVVVADYRLRAGHTGAEVIARIRQRYNRPIPSIIITGDTAPERIREAQAHGLGLLHKPIPADTLHAEIARHLR
ncbi:MAG: PAS domain S-box protein [Magnetospirillum sp.]|nr:PAS domain S-box protein [Magnetospirillum sp.]